MPSRPHHALALPRVALAASLFTLAACGPKLLPPPSMPPASTPAPAETTVVAVPRRTDSTTLAPAAREVALLEVDPPRPTREFRAAWVSPVWAMGVKDWPSRVGMTTSEQQAELRAMLDRARELGLNAVVLHVRMAGDAIYPTPLAPWSLYLSGTSGRAPSPYYDPLAFAIEEAHARGLELHAWFNPFRALMPGLEANPAPTHVARAHPEWVVKYGTQTWIDPGEPAARRSVLDAIVDVVRRYDVDGVHIDDYFYPYRERAPIRVRKGGRRGPVGDLPFPDDYTWRRYGVQSGWTDRNAWRRGNVDQFIRAMYQEVKAEKPWVLVGVSPFGIWRPGSPPGITGLDAFAEIYADSRKWLVEGWVDYLAPQLYWELSGDQARFRRLDAWWRTQNPKDRHLWPGLFTSRVNDTRTSWSLAEIPRQIEWLREQRVGTSEAPGHVHFRLGTVQMGEGGLGERLQAAYAEPAMVPASPWLGEPRPAAPKRAVVQRGVLLLATGDSTPVRWWLLRARDASGRWTSELHPGSDRAVRSPLTDASAYPLLTVAAVGRTEMESVAVGVVRR